MDRSPQNISIVIPCFNEEECIKVLYDALRPVLFNESEEVIMLILK